MTWRENQLETYRKKISSYILIIGKALDMLSAVPNDRYKTQQLDQVPNVV